MIKEVLVFGYNEYAKEIVSNFIEDHYRVHLYVLDELSLANADNDGIKAELVELDDDWHDIAENFDLDSLICFCALDDDADNVFLTISLRAEYKALNIVSLATSKDSANKLKLAGANKAIAKLETTANVIVESLERPAVVEVMNDILYRNKDLKLAEYRIEKGSVIEGALLKEISVHKRFDIIILAIADKKLEAEFTFISQGYDHQLCAGDVLIVMGREKNLARFEAYIMQGIKPEEGI